MTGQTRQAPGKWILTWIIFALFTSIPLYLYEQDLKGRGILPSVDMSKDLWSWHRMRVTCCGTDDPLVLLGASRLLLDISMGELASRYPEKHIYMLGLNGNYPLASLENLANDERFTGTVVVAVNAQALEDRYWDMQQDYVDHYEDGFSFYLALDALLKSLYQSRFAFANSSLSLSEIVQFFDKYHVFKPPEYTTRDADFSIRGDFELTNVELLRSHFVDQKRKNYQDNPPTPPLLWMSQIAKMNELSKKILDRGGKVILIRLPTSDGHWELDETYYPKAEYWDIIARQSLAPAIHFLDIDGLSEFHLPDTSHLDFRDRDSFTTILFDELPIR